MRRMGLGIIVVVVLAAACGGGHKVPTDQPVTGTDDVAVQKRLRNATTAEFVLFPDNGLKYTADPASLAAVEPAIKWAQGLSAPATPDRVNVAISTDGQWFCLTGVSGAGRVLVFAAGPTPNPLYFARAPLSDCSAAVVQGLPHAT